jgi:transposase
MRLIAVWVQARGLGRRMVRHPRFHVHFTPTSASWLNQVERFFAALTEKQINAQPKPFVWIKSANDILNALAKYCERTNDSGH